MTIPETTRRNIRKTLLRMRRGKIPVHFNIKDKRWPGMELVLCAPRFVDEFLESLDNI